MISAAAPRLVCLVGAECTGKTTLATALAQHFGGLVVPETLRDFCDQRGRTPTLTEQAGLMDAQVAQEERVLALATQQGQRFIFCDTAPLLTAVYSEHYFADPSLYALAGVLHQRYALTLLLSPDLPWLADGLQRDGMAVRAQVHALLQRALTGCTPLVLLSGTQASRSQAGVAAVQALAAARVVRAPPD